MTDIRKKFLIGSGVLAAFLGCHIHQNRSVRKKVLEVFYEDLPDALDHYRIAHASDLHGAVYGRNNEMLAKKIRELQPDILCMTGDMVHHENDTGDAFLNMVRNLESSLAKVYVSGNHENARRSRKGFRILERSDLYGRLEDEGVILLDGSTYEPEGLPIVFSGIFDSFEDYNGIGYREEDFHPAEHLPMADRSKFNVALVHRPNYFRSIADYGFELMLSGHIHGGVIRLGRNLGLLSPELKFFPELDKGLYLRGRSYLHVSGGLGMGKPMPRFANPPEIVLLVLRKGRPDQRIKK